MFGRMDELIRRHAGLLKGVAAALAVLALVLLLRSLPVERPLEWLKDRVDALGAWAPVVFVGLFIGLTAVLLPGWPLNVASGVLFGPFVGGAITSLASAAAAAFSFLLGRSVAHRRVARKIVSYPKLHAIYRALGRTGSWRVVAAVRLSHALPFGLQNFLLGVTPIPFWPYLLTTWLVTLPGIFMIAYLGHIGASALESEAVFTDWRWLARAAGFLTAAGALFYVGRTVRRAIKEEMALDLSGDAPPAPSPKDGERANAVRPGQIRVWATLAMLGGALVLLAAAAWTYAERERIRRVAGVASAIQADEHSQTGRRLPREAHRGPAGCPPRPRCRPGADAGPGRQRRRADAAGRVRSAVVPGSPGRGSRRSPGPGTAPTWSSPCRSMPPRVRFSRRWCRASGRAKYLLPVGWPGPPRPQTEGEPMSLEAVSWAASIFLWLFFTGVGIPPVPEEAGILYAAGVAGVRDDVPWWAAWPAASLGIVAADLALYGVGYWLGPRVFEYRLVQRVFSPDRRQRLEGHFRSHGVKFLLLARLLPPLRTGVFLMAGSIRYSLARFLVADVAYGVVGVGLVFFGGTAFVAVAHRYGGWLLLLAALAAGGYLLLRYYRYLRALELKATAKVLEAAAPEVLTEEAAPPVVSR